MVVPPCARLSLLREPRDSSSLLSTLLSLFDEMSNTVREKGGPHMSKNEKASIFSQLAFTSEVLITFAR
jgi:hypothetical protein